MNRSFTIDPVNFERGYEESALTLGSGHYVRWDCKLCRWNGRTTPRAAQERTDADSQAVAGRHGYGRCVP